MNEREQQYLLLLLELERAVDQLSKQEVQQRLARINPLDSRNYSREIDELVDGLQSL